MATYRDVGVVLRTRGLRGDDRLYSVFTEEHGKVSLLAKGMRKTRSKMSPHMATFGTVEIMVARGRQFDRLAGASLTATHRNIVSSLERTATVQSLLLAVDSLTRRELPEPRIFWLLQEFMAVMDGDLPAGGGRQVMNAAMVKLFDVLGFGLEIDVCVGCRGAIGFDGSALNVLRGGVECRRCRSGTSLGIMGDTVKVLRFLRRERLSRTALLRLTEQVRDQVSFVVDLLATSNLEARFDPLRYLESLRV
ncbi:MAG: DNA repair protein RecO [bacterium]